MLQNYYYYYYIKKYIIYCCCFNVLWLIWSGRFDIFLMALGLLRYCLHSVISHTWYVIRGARDSEICSSHFCTLPSSTLFHTFRINVIFISIENSLDPGILRWRCNCSDSAVVIIMLTWCLRLANCARLGVP